MNTDMDQKYIAWRKAQNRYAKILQAYRNLAATTAQVDAARNAMAQAYRAIDFTGCKPRANSDANRRF